MGPLISPINYTKVVEKWRPPVLCQCAVLRLASADFFLSFATNAPQPGGNNPSGCRNSLPNCDAYGQNVCSDPTYTQWVNDNCRSFCGKCSCGSQPVPTAAPAAPSGCQDSLPNCDAYGQNVCSAPAYTQWVNDNCRSFCGKCSAPGPSTGCTDVNPQCASFGSGICSDSKYTIFVDNNCRNFCSRC